MATASIAVEQRVWLRPKYVLGLGIGLMLAYVAVHNEAFLIHAQDPEWQHIHPFRWYLLPHGLAGACALLLAPMQFWDSLRCKYAKLHRVVGRFYVGGVLIAAPMGFYVQYFQTRAGASEMSFSAAAATQAVTWTVTTLIAMAFILKGKVELHRRWMTRSFSVALVFLEVRVLLGVTGWENLGPHVVEAAVWGCNVFALFAADVVLQWQELLRQSSVASRRSAAKA